MSPKPKGVDEPSPSRRRDIQGLRALAVLVVIAYHADLPMPGGFVGVDVFFVTSGFVITAMLHREWTAGGRISLSNFYLRRFKRLIPALALAVATTMVLSAVFLSPLHEQQTSALTGLAAMLSVANFAIARFSGDYFAAPAEANPLLHTWSLSVEEQFYLFFPLLIGVAWRASRNSQKHTVIPTLAVSAVALASFLLAMPISPGNWFQDVWLMNAFYSSATRTWEFLCGVLLALYLAVRRPNNRHLASVAGALGFIGVLSSLWLINANTTFPGPWTLLPTASTVLILFAGGHAENPISRLLSIKPLVKVGDWSYSLYLWHWPLIVLGVGLWPSVPHISKWAAALAFAPALASYRWVEQPLRNSSVVGRRSVVSLVSIVLIPPIVLAGGVGFVATNYWLPKFQSGEFPVIHPGDTEWADLYLELEKRYYPCANSRIREGALEWKGITRCRQSLPSEQVDVALVGDSHAEHLFLGLAEARPETNFAFYILGQFPVEDGAQMSVILSEVEADPSISTVILNAKWSDHTAATTELTDTVQRLSNSGKQVFLTDDVPSYSFHAYSCKYRKSPWVPITTCTQSFPQFAEIYSSYRSSLEAIVEAVPGSELLSTFSYFCNSVECSMTSAEGLLMFRDGNHLNNIGSRYIASRLLQDNPSFLAALGRR